MIVEALASITLAVSSLREARIEVQKLFRADAKIALCVIQAESNWNPAAVSSTGDHGLFQLNAWTWKRWFGSRWQGVYDPVANVRMAHAIYRRAGHSFAPWTTSRRCR